MRGNLKHDSPYIIMRRSFGYVVGILICCICLSVQPIAAAEFTEEELLHPESLSAEDWFEIGNIFFDNGELSDAVGSWHNAMYLDPELAANAWYNIGLAYAAVEQYSDAIEAWENTVAIQPDSAMAYDNLGTAYGIIGMADKSLEAYDKAIAIAPDEPKYKADRATLIAALGGAPAEEKKTPLSQLVSIAALCGAIICIIHINKKQK
ncbi:MAG: tetratricopeptide repeat protein [Methanomicrobiales archaeon]|jgi:tetratricopeptide (TPR) repeat protein|nr:tetratricopeptide repeat protein [Methanomicrobiales archaeon]